jgi:LPS-assembly protein
MRVWIFVWMISALVAALGAQETSAQETSAADDRVTVSVKLDDARGGGRLQIWAGDFEYQEGEYVLATDGVELKYRSLHLQAELLRVDIASNLLTAEGSIILDEGPRRLIGDTLEYNLAEGTGRFTQATAFVENEYYFTGDVIEQVSDTTFTLDHGTFSACSVEQPEWSLHMGHGKVTLDDYARFKNVRMKLGKVPIFYLPYMLWPTTTDRSSGLLVPQPGFSNRRGWELGLAYYKTLGRSADVTLYTDLTSKAYFGFGTELRYRPSEKSQGLLELYALNDPETESLVGFSDISDTPIGFHAGGAPVDTTLLPEDLRWKLHYFHETKDFWGGFRAIVNINEFSDPTYRQDFERNVNRQTKNFIYSQAYLTRNFGQQSFNILVDQREQINLQRYTVNPDLVDGKPLNGEIELNGSGEERRVGRVIETRRQLPEIEYRLRPTRLGESNIYFNVDGNLHNLYLDSDKQGKSTFSRADLFSSLSLPVSTLPWLSVKLDVGGRATYYTNSIDPLTNKFFGDESNLGLNEKDKAFDRTLGVAGVEVIGPSFSRIFEKKKPGRFAKFKHIIEPRIEYTYRDDFNDPLTPQFLLDENGDPVSDDNGDAVYQEGYDGEVPLFDEIDRFRIQNEAVFSLTNRILAKPSDPEAGGGFEILSFALQLPYSFDPEQPLQVGNAENPDTQEGPVRGIFRFNPSRTTSLKLEARYNTLFSQIQSLSFSGGVKLGRHSLGGSLQTSWVPATGVVRNNQARVFTSLALGKNLSLDANLSFDLEDDAVTNPLQQRYFLKYEGSCYGLQLELRESQFGGTEDRDFRFSFSLKNVGKFLDMNGSI